MSVTTGEVFAERLRETRRTARLSQAELASRISALTGTPLPATAITKIEKGERAVRLDEAVAAARALEVPLSALVSEETPTDARIRELREELVRQQSRADAAIAEHQQATAAMIEIEREIERLEASRPE